MKNNIIEPKSPREQTKLLIGMVAAKGFPVVEGYDRGRYITIQVYKGASQSSLTSEMKVTHQRIRMLMLNYIRAVLENRKSLKKRAKLSIEIARTIASTRGGKCLSTVYNNSRENLIWQCSEGHIWEAPLTSIKDNKTWCPYCNANRFKKH